MEKRFYLTTAIPYVNAEPHIGFALELVQSDAVARFQRLSGKETYFLTGADENSLKNVQAAEKQGTSVRELVDKNTKKFIDLTSALNISNNQFIRTTSAKHFAACRKLWSLCKKEDIYKKEYRGLYCVGCETFYTEKELIDGKCPEHLKEPEVVEEENYFFKLSNYQKKLEKLISGGEYEIIPGTRKNEILSFIKMGLEDFSISRSMARAKNWGVPVPDDPEQVIYVWFDALTNYISALDFSEDQKLYKKFWPADLHVIGKGIIRFHAVYWPAMLLSAGLPLPKKLFVHGYINIEGQKISKSLGNVINPFDLISKYGVEPVRYFLFRYIHPFQDSDFTIKHFEESYNADLANGLGNLVNRVSNLIETNDLKIKIKPKLKFYKEVKEAMENFYFDSALKFIWQKITETDKLINDTKPWILAKENRTEELENVLAQAADNILSIAFNLQPFMPESAEKIIRQFVSKKIKKERALFPRLV
ncbi:methionine--tRNA ligase [Candidatus Parcubacteria bacterium]|nr:MAG: methionine--tRNA ligase [Candidatus Parcubacteria bacterium]